MTRSERRTAERHLRRIGCTCKPRLAPGSCHGFDCLDVEHVRGCVLGDRMLVYNRAGILPVLPWHAPSRCDR